MNRRCPRRARAWPTACAAVAVVTAVACAATSRTPPSADDPKPPAPDLTGRSVMVLPAQAPGLRSARSLDAELAFWLGDRAPRVQWVFPPTLADALARTPALDIPLHALAVSSFHRARVERIGDPLFGDLRQLGALVNARYALVPVAASYVAEAGNGRIELATALIDTVGGSVLWFGVVGGARGAPADPAVTASAAQALARALFP